MSHKNDSASQYVLLNDTEEVRNVLVTNVTNSHFRQ